MPTGEKSKQKINKIQEKFWAKNSAKSDIIFPYIPGCDSRTFSNIVPCIMGHENPTEENSEYSTQF